MFMYSFNVQETSVTEHATVETDYTAYFNKVIKHSNIDH